MPQPSAEKILKSLRDSKTRHYDAYVRLYGYFETNSRALMTLDISTGVVMDSDLLAGLEEKLYDTEGLSKDEKRELTRQLNAEKKRLENDTKRAERRYEALMKFGKEYKQIQDTLDELAKLIKPEDLKRAQKTVEFLNNSGMTVEERVASRRNS